jgi:RimJ/RimL family protein N-acetyltransferase
MELDIMNLRGKKTMLRALEPEDNEMLRGMMNDPEIEAMTGGFSFPVSSQQQRDWLMRLNGEKGVLRCAIVSGEQAAIGTIILSDIDYKNGNAQISIKIAKKEDRGAGYGSDAVTALVEYAFSQLRLKCVYAYISEQNAASCGMFEKCGFKREGLLRSRIFKNGAFHNTFVYSILNSQE